MKPIQSLVVASLVLVSSVGAAEAREKSKKSAPVQETSAPVETSSTSESSSTTLGLGLSTYDFVSNINPAGSVHPAVSIWVGLGKLAIQGLLSIPETEGSLKFGIAALAKYTILESGSAGFHVGGGLGMGLTNTTAATTANFTMDLGPIFGIHYSLSGAPQLMFQLDAGPVFNLEKTSTTVGGVTDSSTVSTLALSPLSGFLGASVNYLF